jgi:hypothetical protein
LLKIGTRTAGFRHQLLLAMSAALELGDNGESPVSFLVGTPGIKKKDSGDQYGDGEEGRDANFQSPPHGKGIACHLLGYSERLESGLRHFAAFIGNASFLQQIVKRVFFAQLNAHAREQFRRIPRESKHLVRAEIETPSSLSSLTLREENHASPRGGRIAFDFGKGIAALDVGKVGGEKQKVNAGILNKLESFSLGGRYGHVIAGRTHQFLKHTARGRVGIHNQNALAFRGQVRDLNLYGFGYPVEPSFGFRIMFLATLPYKASLE